MVSCRSHPLRGQVGYCKISIILSHPIIQLPGKHFPIVSYVPYAGEPFACVAASSVQDPAIQICFLLAKGLCPLPLAEKQSRRENIESLLHLMLLLKNHIFMSVNESKTYGWNFLVWCEWPHSPSSVLRDDACNVSVGARISSGKVRAGALPSPTIDPCSPASTWTSPDPQEISPWQTTSHSLMHCSLRVIKAIVHIHTCAHTYISTCTHMFAHPKKYRG